ncbi:MAG TPA: 2'-5' RNA ligase family protein, partial [Planctomycetes bacterium]|nr:2'-5' RNA ligase family protein [Planctomycetota bacterium]
MLTSSVVVIPPEPVRRRIDEVRRRYDKAWVDVVLGHVSLIRPLKRLISPKETEHIRAAMSNVPAFTAATSHMEALSTGDGLYLVVGVEPEEPFIEMHRHLARILGRETAFLAFRPHFTVGSFVNSEALARAYEEVKKDFPVVDFYTDAVYEMVVDTEA